MFKNYLKITMRNINRYKGFSFINILGLAVGITCCILILLYIQYEFSFDDFHKNSDSIYRILINQDHYYQGRNQVAVTPPPLGPAIKERFPEVWNICRIDDSRGLFKTGDRSFYENHLGFVDPEFLIMFSFPLILGDKRSVLTDPFSLVISEEMATKYFGDIDPLGQIISIDDKHNYTVTGVMKNIPKNSYFQFDFLASWSTLPGIYSDGRMNSWHSYSYLTFLELAENTDILEFEQKVQVLFNEHKTDFMTGCQLQNLKQIHFHNKALFEQGTTSDINAIYILATIGLAILLIACFNYINLATARVSTRIREIGIRKVIGAQRVYLIRQFLGESIGLAFIAFVIAILLSSVLLPSFCSFMRREIPSSFIFKPQNLFLMIGLLFGIGIISGFYPSLLLSSFRPMNILRGASQIVSGRKSRFRNYLVILQFTITTILIVCTLVTRKQISYVKNSDLGYEQKSILTFPVYRAGIKPIVIKQELLQHHSIQDAVLSSQTPALISNAGLPNWDGKNTDENIPFFRLYIDENFLDFYGIPLQQGRNITIQDMEHPETAVILNESAVKATGWTEPLGRRIYDGDDDVEGKTVIGVVKDFHFASLHIPIAPLMIMANPNDYDYLSLKIESKNVPNTIQFLEDKWNTYSSNASFNYAFIDDRITNMYSTEYRLQYSLQIFAFMAIFIACLGLIGITSYTVERKTKEIGIRKVLGASVTVIIGMLIQRFTVWILFASIIAWPVAYYFMNKWLQNFAYRVDIGIWIFILSAALALIIALVTVSYQSIKAAMANPVESL
ncbi:MAG: ABC transporter permease, partial [bacterium]